MMPFSSSSIEQAIEAATDGKKTSENWAEILEIVDLIEEQPNGAKEAVKVLVKRIKHKDPHVALHALTVLEACVANAKRKFHLEVASRFFDDEVRAILQNTQNYPRPVIEKLCQLIKKWSENEFKSETSLSIIPSLYNHIKNTNPSYITEMVLGKSTTSQPPAVKNVPDNAKQKEEEDFAKAVALSLQEDQKKKRSSSASAVFTPAASSSLYPSMNDTGPIYATVNKSKEAKEPRKVRAMYDFEAVEDNELTFKAGEILHVLDDSDPNWWKGSNHRGEGLFPTNFVTSDLNWEPENEFPKKQSKEDTRSAVSEAVEQKPVTIDEGLIDKTLNMIHDADPTGERQDPADLLALEDQCNRMWPLIDEELQKTDKMQSELDELSNQINDALAMYDRVMMEQAAQLTGAGPYVSTEHAMHPGVGYYPSQPTMPSHMVPGQYPPNQQPQMPYYPGQMTGHVDPSAVAAHYSGHSASVPQQGFQQYGPSPAKLAAAGVPGAGSMPPQPQTYPEQQQASVSQMYGVQPQGPYAGHVQQ